MKPPSRPPARTRPIDQETRGSRAPRRRLPAAEREQQIVAAATRFFAEHGFGGQTRELARGIGITHSAIFRYFPTKEALIEEVYHQVYVKRWDQAWGDLILDRGQTMVARLTCFYRAYAARIFHYDWVRIFVFSGLKGNDIAPRYLATLRDRLIRPACAEMRAELGLPGFDLRPLTEREEEAVWALHGKVFYLAIRKFVYGLPVPADLGQTIVDDVRVFLSGAPPIFREGAIMPDGRHPS